MSQSQGNRGVAYVRDTSDDGPDQINLLGKPRPRELRRLLETAAQEPRPFDVVIVAHLRVLGRPEEAHRVIAELANLGITVDIVHQDTEEP